MRNQVFVFDLETIIDEDVAGTILGNRDQDLSTAIFEYHKTNYSNDFPRAVFWKIACLSYVSAEFDATGFKVKSIKSAGELDSDELQIITGFKNYCIKNKPRLVSYNGKNFDIPVLKYRFMKHDMDMAWFYAKTDDTKWAKDTYNDKWGEEYNLDLYQFYKQPNGGMNMREACSIFQIPVKMDIDGGEVAESYKNGYIMGIRNYCEQDAIATYILFLISCFHRGELTHDQYSNSMTNLLQCLGEKSEQHFIDFFSDCKKSAFLSKFIK